MRKIGVQLLVGENSEPFLPYALRSVAWADYFCVVNVGRPDNAIAQQNSEIVHAEIPADKLRYTAMSDRKLAEDIDFWKHGRFSFAEARNLCLQAADLGDLVFIVDSDDVHFPEWEHIVRNAVAGGADSITAYFYHLMVYKNIYQFVQPREIIYPYNLDTHWTSGVHEQLACTREHPEVSPYHYLHYGYIKPQSEVFKRWKFYSDLEGDFHHYDGQNPDAILDDRVSVCEKLPVAHPEFMHEFLQAYPDFDGPETGAAPDLPDLVTAKQKVALILLVTNGEEYLEDCLSSLAKTTGVTFELFVINQASTDRSGEILKRYSEIIPMVLIEVEEFPEEGFSICKTQNYALNHYRRREDTPLIGFIHNDMRFDQPEWLEKLCRVMEANPKIGKLCAANSRDPLPKELIPGHEQAFIMRRDVVNKVGLFDVNYVGIGGYEDWDYNRRILNHDNHTVCITPEAQVYHYGMGTREKLDTTAEQIANANYYAQKWNTSNAPC